MAISACIGKRNLRHFTFMCLYASLYSMTTFLSVALYYWRRYEELDEDGRTRLYDKSLLLVLSFGASAFCTTVGVVNSPALFFGSFPAALFFYLLNQVLEGGGWYRNLYPASVGFITMPGSLIILLFVLNCYYAALGITMKQSASAAREGRSLKRRYPCRAKVRNLCFFLWCRGRGQSEF